MNRHFARKCDCHAMVNSLAIARIAIFTRNLRLSSLRLYALLVLRVSMPSVSLFQPLSVTGRFAWMMAVALHGKLLLGDCNFQIRQKSKRPWSRALKKMECLYFQLEQLQRACSSHKQRMRVLWDTIDT